MYNPAAYLPNQNTYNFGDPLGAFAQGYQAITLPEKLKQQQEAQNMKNALLKQQVQTQPQMDDEKLKALQQQNQYYPQQQQAKIALLKAQQQAANAPKEPSGEYYGLIKYYETLPPGPEKDMVKQRLDKLAALNQGTTVYGPDGKPIASVGGSVKPGSIGVDANGNPISKPTTAVDTKLQQSVIGMNNVLPYFDTIVKDLSQFQTGPEKAQLGYEKFANQWLGGNYEGPSIEAEGLASVNSAAEGLMRAFGLNATNESLNKMAEIMSPHKGESPEQYKKRAGKQAVDFLNIQKRAQAAQQGIPLTQNNSQNNSEKTYIIEDENGNQKTVTAEEARQHGVQI